MDYDGIYILIRHSDNSGQGSVPELGSLKVLVTEANQKSKLEKQKQKQWQPSDPFLILSTGFLHKDNPFF